MKNKKSFRRGDVVKCATNAVLVTGNGNGSYPAFAGVADMISFLLN